MSEFTSINSYDSTDNSGNLSSDIEENDSSEMSNDISYEAAKQLIPRNYHSEEDDIDESKLYFIQPKKKHIFTTVNKNTEYKTQFTGKKRGKCSIKNNKKSKRHDRFSNDNILRKINNHSLNSTISFFNDFFKHLNIKEKFCKLSYKSKINIKKNYFYKIKKKSLGKIISSKISKKYNKHDENDNNNIYKNYKNHEVLKRIFEMDYATFFKRYYMESKKCINLKDFGLEIEIILSDECKMYNDLIESIRKSNDEDNEKYIESIQKCIEKNFYSKKLFTTSK